MSRPCSFRKTDKFFCSSGKQVGFIFQINTIVQFKIWSFSSKAQYNEAFLIHCTVWEVAFSRHNTCCLCIAPLLSRDALVCNCHGALILITCSAVTGGWEVWGGSAVFLAREMEITFHNSNNRTEIINIHQEHNTSYAKQHRLERFLKRNMMSLHGAHEQAPAGCRCMLGLQAGLALALTAAYRQQHDTLIRWHFKWRRAHNFFWNNECIAENWRGCSICCCSFTAQCQALLLCSLQLHWLPEPETVVSA